MQTWEYKLIHRRDLANEQEFNTVVAYGWEFIFYDTEYCMFYFKKSIPITISYGKTN